MAARHGRGTGNDGSRITVRDLLRQTSGLYDCVDDPEVAGVLRDFDTHRYDAAPAASCVAVAMRHRPLFTPRPGGTPRWAYSNTNYLPAGRIAEKAGGLPWREQVEHRVIAPLGLPGTRVTGANPFLPGPHARVTLPIPGKDGKPLDVTEHSLQHGADSAVISTTRDLDTFFRALMTGKLLPRDRLAQMKETVERTDAPEDLAARPEGGYGLGLRANPLSCGGRYRHHEGDGFGPYTRTGVTEDGRRAVTVSITSDGGLPDQERLNAGHPEAGRPRPVRYGRLTGGAVTPAGRCAHLRSSRPAEPGAPRSSRPAEGRPSAGSAAEQPSRADSAVRAPAHGVRAAHSGADRRERHTR